MILPKKKQAFMVSAMKSGSGKTLITLGLINILKNMGKTISIYKTGPDYIDTMYHEKIAGTPSTNLDPFFLEPEYRPGELKNLFFKNLQKSTLKILLREFIKESQRKSNFTKKSELTALKLFKS